MKVCVDWLKDFIRIREPLEKVAERLTMCGLEAKFSSEADKQGNAVLETEVTTNRPDWLSHVGVARELAALYGRPFKLPDTRYQRFKQKIVPSGERITVKIQDTKRCPYYTCIVLEGIVNQPSPEFMQKRLETCGLRPINLMVDVTNYVLLEMGQPLHAFDLDYLEGREIIVRTAGRGESLTAINGTGYTLCEEDLVIADRRQPIAMAGVMGGKPSEMTASSHRVLLESAYFDPHTVRATSRRLDLASDSSYRFERGVDPLGVDAARDRAVFLIRTHGTVSKISRVFKAGRAPFRPKKILFSMDLLKKTVGIDMPPARVRKIMTGLSLSVRPPRKKVWEAGIPSWRSDLLQPIDLVEEVVRIYGYDRIPETLPSAGYAPESGSGSFDAEESARQILFGAGFYETVTFSLENPDLLNRLGFASSQAAMLVNPQNVELSVMRPTLLVSLLRAFLCNVDAGREQIRLFELAPVYGREEKSGLPSEEIHAACLLSGFVDAGWSGANRPVGFFDIKGVAELLLSRLGATGFSFQPSPHAFLGQGEALNIFWEGNAIGLLGTVSDAALQALGIKQKAWVLEINLDILFSRNQEPVRYRPPYRFPSAKRDIAMIIKDSIDCKHVQACMQESGGNLIRSMCLFDLFRGGTIPSGFKSLAFSIEYGSEDRTLASDEVNSTHEKIGQALSKMLGAQIR